MDGKKIKKYWFVLALILVLFLRLPSLFEPFTYGDEGIYLTLGQAARKGLIWYRDIHDNKPPMLYLLAAIAGTFSTYRLILFVWSFVTIFVFYKLANFVFSKNKSAVMVSTTAFAILSSLHSFEGNVANAENFMLLPIIGGVLLILKSLDLNELKANLHRFLLFFLSGILFSLAALFKIPAAFDFAAVAVLLLLIFLEQKKKNYKLFTIHYSLFFFGFFFPIILTIIYYALRGALNQYLNAAFFQNIPYLSSWTGDNSQVSGLPLAFITRGFLMLALIVSLFILEKQVSRTVKLILLWFAFSLFAALLSSRPYPHYLIQVLPALCLSFGLFWTKTKKAKLSVEKIIPSTLLLILIFVFLSFKFWYYPNLPYFANFYQFALGLKSKNEYFAGFDKHAPTLYQIASYIRNRNQKKEKIFIWGTQPSIYALSKRLPVGRYTTSYHIIDFNGYEQTILALTQAPPRYIIVTSDENRPFPALFTFIQTNYTFAAQINNFQIFHRILEVQ